VSWLTLDHGKIATIVKGAVRPKSAFLGQYDLFYSCELLFYSRERNGTHVLRECSVVDPRSSLRTDWRATACASYLCDLVSRMSMTGEQCPELYELLECSLNYLASGNSGASLLLWFELKAAEAIGFSPRLTKCPSCNRRLFVGQDAPEFSSSRGGLLCPECAGGTSETIPITPDAVMILQSLQRVTVPEALAHVCSNTAHLHEISGLLGMFLQYHIQPSLAGRLIATEIAM
jgi:DNA repair protein RecO (recombination protein O)